MNGNLHSVERWLVESATPSDAVRIDAVRERLFGQSRRRMPDHYQLHEELGRGRFGRVYRATDSRFPRTVALKIIGYDPASPTELERLELEAHTLARLSDPHIVQVYEKGIADIGSYYLAMEYVEGSRLDQWWKNSDRSLDQILDVFAQAAEGLHHAHQRLLVHRDFKPSNVIVGIDGRVRILDFGLAKSTSSFVHPSKAHGTVIANRLDRATLNSPAVSQNDSLDSTSAGASLTLPSPRADETRGEGDDLTEAGAFVGTPFYAAPEQLACEMTDSRSDQFSFCVALFEAVYGARPFVGRTTMEVRIAIEAGPLSFPRAPRRVPHWLKSLLRRGLSFDPSRRFDDMGQISEILRRHLSHQLRPRLLYLATGAVAASIAALLIWRPSPIDLSWKGAWPSSFGPDEVEALHGTALRQRLEAYESDWRTARATYEQRPDRDPNGVPVKCLEAGKESFTNYINRLREAPAKNLDGRPSTTRERMWLEELFDPQDCLGPEPKWEADQELAKLLFDAEVARLNGDYLTGRRLLEEARDRVPRDLSLRSGLIDYHLGTAQMYTWQPEAWKTLRDAEAANGGDEQFLTDVRTRLFEVGVFVDTAAEAREMDALLDLLEARHAGPDQAVVFVSKGHNRFHEGNYSAAKEFYARARESFEARGDQERNAFMIAYSRLHEAFMESWKAAPEIDPAQLARDFDVIRESLGASHPVVLRFAIKVARVLENVGKHVEARDLLEQALQDRGIVPQADQRGSFDVQRVRAELVHLDITIKATGAITESDLDQWRATAMDIERKAFEAGPPLARRAEIHRVRELLIEAFGRVADLDAAVRMLDAMDRDARTKEDHEDVCHYSRPFEGFVSTTSIESKNLLERLLSTCPTK